MEQLTFVTELVLDLVPELDVPGEVLVCDLNAADWAALLWHQAVPPCRYGFLTNQSGRYFLTNQAVPPEI